jgi:hypothetical protein
MPMRKTEPVAPTPAPVQELEESVTEIEGLVRDERGVRLGREEAD